MKKWPEKIKEFRDREDSKRTPSKHCKVLKSRPKFYQLNEQPTYMGKEKDLVLRDYQMDGVNWMIHSWCKENRYASISVIIMCSKLLHLYSIYFD